MDEARDEWCFDFYVHAAAPIPAQLMDGLLWEEVINWAEGHQLGVGGGLRAASLQQDAAAQCWHFRFGLCASEDGQIIPASQADELEQLLRAWCSDRSLEFAGGFRAFTPDECNPEAQSS